MTSLTTMIARTVALATLTAVVGLSPAAAASSSSYEKDIHTATNAFRSHLGKSSVKTQSCVDKWAESQAKWMADHQVMAHREGRLRKIMKACKLTGASENIAWNFQSGSDTVDAWAKSPGHAKNMRAGKMRYIGVGAVQDGQGQWWVAQVFGTRK